MLTFCKTPQIALCKNYMFPAMHVCLYLYLYLYTILIRFLHSLGFVHNLQKALGVYIQIQRHAYYCPETAINDCKDYLLLTIGESMQGRMSIIEKKRGRAVKCMHILDSCVHVTHLNHTG